MKKQIYIIALALLAIGTGCGVDTPQFDGNKLFIVESIENYGDSTCRYKGKSWSLDYLLSINYPQFIAKKNLFQIGDTVKVSK